jgi:hypothetical protein
VSENHVATDCTRSGKFAQRGTGTPGQELVLAVVAGRPAYRGGPGGNGSRVRGHAGLGSRRDVGAGLALYYQAGAYFPCRGGRWTPSRPCSPCRPRRRRTWPASSFWLVASGPSRRWSSRRGQFGHVPPARPAPRIPSCNPTPIFSAICRLLWEGSFLSMAAMASRFCIDGSPAGVGSHPSPLRKAPEARGRDEAHAVQHLRAAGAVPPGRPGGRIAG